LLNYLCATQGIRCGAIGGHLPQNNFYRFVLDRQRKDATKRAGLLRAADELAAVTLVSEIACCPTCTAHSIDRFKMRHPNVELQVVELGKQVSKGTPTSYKNVKISVW
jgi:hypothetical protein